MGVRKKGISKVSKGDMSDAKFCTIESRDDLENIHEILRSTKKAIASNDFLRLTKLSDRTIHSATVNQDPVNIVVAVLVYALSKIFQREGYQRMDGWDSFYNSLMERLETMSTTNDCDTLLETAGEVRESLNQMEGNLATYIKDIFRKAEINKGYKMYEHGLSSKKIASLLGINLWDFASYIGQSQMGEAHIAITMPQEERLKHAEEFFA